MQMVETMPAETPQKALSSAGGAEYGRGRVGRHGALGRETSSCLRGAAGVEERVGGGVDTLRIRPQSPGWLCGRERVAR